MQVFKKYPVNNLIKFFEAHEGVSVFIIAFIFYMLTVAPTVISGDSAEYAKLVYQFKLFFWRADSHPLHVIVGKIFSYLPLELAYSMNILSALFAAVTISLLYLVIRKFSGSVVSSLLGALSFMVAHTFWFYAVITEVYSLHIFFVVLLIYIAVNVRPGKWKKWIFLLVFLLALFNHLLILLTLPAFFFYYLSNLDKKGRRKIWLGLLFIVLVLLITFLIFLFLYHQKTIKILKLVLLRDPPVFAFLLPPTDLKIFFKELIFYFLYLFYQFPLIGFILGFWGIYSFYRTNKKLTWFLLILILCNGLFFVKFTYWQSYGGTKFTFYLPDYLVFSIFIGLGFNNLWQRLSAGRRKFTLSDYQIKIVSVGLSFLIPAVTVVFYALMPHLVTYLNIDLIHTRTLSGRDNNRFFLNPNKSGYYNDRKLGEEILASAADHSIVLADYTIYTTLTYLQLVENIRPDLDVERSEGIKIVDYANSIKHLDPNRKIYVSDIDEDDSYYNLHGLGERFELRKSGYLYEICGTK